MDFQDVRAFNVKNEEDFNEAIKIFTLTSQTERLALYSELAQENNVSEAQAKDFLLRNVFGDYIQNKLKKALQIAQFGGDKEAYEQIQLLKNLEPIFKDYDIHTHEGFLTSVEPDLNALEASLLFMNHVLNDYECQAFSEAIVQALSGKATECKDKHDYISKLLSHPILKCLNSHKDSKSLITNIKNDIIELGHYKDLVLSVLEVGLDLNREEHQRLLFFIVNEDIKHNGLFNILKKPSYEPDSLKTIINNIIEGKQVNSQMLDKTTQEISQAHTHYAKITMKGEIKNLISSNKSLMDSGFFNEEFNLFLHIHTAQDSGNNQNSQQINTSLTYQNNGYDTVGVTVIQKDVIDLNSSNSYLAEFKQSLNVNAKEKTWLNTLQISSEHMLLLANREDEIEKTDYLASQLLLSEKNVAFSIELAQLKQGKSDLDNILEDKQMLFNILSKNTDVFHSIISFTSSDNQKAFQHLASPILTQIKAILLHEENLDKSLLNKDDLAIIEQVVGNTKTLNNHNTLALVSEINRSIKRRPEYEQSALTSGELLNWSAQESASNSIDHLSSLTNHMIDCVAYWQDNDLDTSLLTDEKRDQLNQAIIERINYECFESDKKLVSAPKASDVKIIQKKVAEVIKTLTKEEGVLVFSKSDYVNPKYPAASLIARLILDVMPHGRKSESKLADDTRLLNLFGMLARVNNTKIQAIQNGKNVENEALNRKLKIK